MTGGTKRIGLGKSVRRDHPVRVVHPGVFLATTVYFVEGFTVSEVKRFNFFCSSDISQEGRNTDFVLASDYDAAQSELTALREELSLTAKMYGDSAEDLQQRLTAAEQRNAELVELLRDARWRIVNKNTSTDDYKRLDKPVVERIDTALKPTESGASE